MCLIRRISVLACVYFIIVVCNKENAARPLQDLQIKLQSSNPAANIDEITGAKKHKRDIFDTLWSFFSNFGNDYYDSDEAWTDDDKKYLICSNCTVGISQERNSTMSTSTTTSTTTTTTNTPSMNPPMMESR